MFFVTAQDLWYFVASISALCVTLFLCWALYEVARAVRQIDEMLTTTRETAGRLEDQIESLVERVTSLAGYAGLITTVGKRIVDMVGSRKSAIKNNKKGKQVDEE